MVSAADPVFTGVAGGAFGLGCEERKVFSEEFLDESRTLRAV